MNYDAWADHLMTDAERATFEEQGYFVVKGAMDSARVDRLNAVVQRLREENRGKSGFGSRDKGAGTLGASDRMNLKDCAVMDPELIALLTLETTFPKVFGALGWNIQLYHSQCVIAPPVGSDGEDKNRGSWHQDSDRLNIELEGEPRPRISLKVGFYLSDNTTTGCGNFCVVPGSHKFNTLPRPAPGAEPENATEVIAEVGDAVLFDRRIWHTATPNRADFDRKILFYGYSYRWLRPRSDIAISPQLIDTLDPMQRQLLGVGSTNMSCTSPLDEDVPLKVWMEANMPPASMPAQAALRRAA